MIGKTCCFTGHRTILPAEQLTIHKRLRAELETLIAQGVQYFGAGGALGFDTLAAKTVIQLKASFPQIKLILVLPCYQQSSGWPTEDIAMYNYIMHHANKIVYTSKEYYHGCMQKRNRHLVDNSQICLTYLYKKTGGTAYTVDYANKSGLQIINIAQKTPITSI